MSEPAKTTEITIRYFAWVREKVGRAEERVVLPTDVVTVADMVRWLQARGPEFAAAFAQPEVIRAARDRVHVQADVAIGDAREIGFFPPVTGG